jgi:hypothetical protein
MFCAAKWAPRQTRVSAMHCEYSQKANPWQIPWSYPTAIVTRPALENRPPDTSSKRKWKDNEVDS